jgi:hypothetical protein
MLVITKDTAIGHFATGMKTIGHGAKKTTLTHACQSVHIGGVGMLQKSLSAERFMMPIGHAIAKNNNVLHIAGLC